MAINQANQDTDYGVAMQIRRNALDLEAKTQIEETKADETIKKADNSAAGLYTGIATEILVPGGKLATALVEGVYARAKEAPGASSETESELTPMRSIDADVGLANRAPGVYNARPQSIYGGNPKIATDLSSNILEQVKLTTDSLRPPVKDTAGLVQADGSGNISGMKSEVTKETLKSAQFAKKLCSLEIADKPALDSTFAYERSHSAAMGMGMGGGIAPSMMQKLAPRDIGSLLTEIKET